MNNSKYGYFFSIFNCIYFYAQRRWYLLLLFLLYSINGLGQYSITGKGAALNPHVMNSNGGSVIIHQMLLDWNLGDLASTFKVHQNPTILLTTGFLQNHYPTISLFKDLSGFGEQIKIGPNPFYNEIHIYCKQDGINIISIRILDSKGSMLKYIKGPFSGLAFEKHIELKKGKYPFYFVQISYSVANSFSLYKTYKLLQY